MQNRLFQLRTIGSDGFLRDRNPLRTTSTYPWPQLLRAPCGGDDDQCVPQPFFEIIYYARFMRYTQMRTQIKIYEDPEPPQVGDDDDDVVDGFIKGFLREVLTILMRFVTYPARSLASSYCIGGRAPLREIGLLGER